MKILTAKISENENFRPLITSKILVIKFLSFAPTMFGGNYFYKKINNKTGGEL